jgi:pyruvate decarboxylase
MMKEYLSELAKQVQKNTTAYENYKRIFVPEDHPLKGEVNEALRVMCSSSTSKICL